MFILQLLMGPRYQLDQQAGGLLHLLLEIFMGLVQLTQVQMARYYRLTLLKLQV
jgi:hypothetical protein